MKKNLFLGMLAAVGMLFATSCSTDEPEAPSSGNEAQVTFALDLEGAAQTRAISDGSGATELVYAVYQKVSRNTTTLLKLTGSDENSQFIKDGTFNPAGDNVTLRLAKGQTYVAVFWAQNPNCKAYTTTDLANVTVDYAGVNNDETRDAFYKAEEFTVIGDATISVTLKRPFAQINVGVPAEDWENAVASGVKITDSKVVIKSAATAINLLDGTVSGEADVTYKYAAIPTEKLSVDTDNDGTKEEYNYLSMSYILTGTDKATADTNFTFKPEAGNNIVLHDGLTAVPVQRNWRTNIIGNFLTDQITFNIVVDPIYDGDHNFDYPELQTIAKGVTLDAASKTYYLTSTNGLMWFNEQARNGNLFQDYTVKLTSDASLLMSPWTPIPNFKGTFDGCGYTIQNLYITTTDGASAGFFASAVGGTVKNLKVKNVRITGDWKAGTIVGDGLCAKIENCHVDGSWITVTPRLTPSGYDDANNVGGITGYLSAEPTAWVKDCSVTDLTITAYRDVGGIVGKANGDGAVPVISGNTVSNVTVIANQLHEYIKPYDANADELVGRNMVNADLSSNTAENVTVSVLAVDNNGKVEIGENIPLPNIANLANTDVKEIALTGDVKGTASVMYGSSKVGISLPAGVILDGNNHSLTSTTMTTAYVVMTQGGTIKNLSAIEGGQRGIVTGACKEDVIIDNVVIDQPGYALNTAEPATKENLKLIVRNTTLNGWSSWAGGFASAEFTSCSFGENSTKYWQKRGNDQMFDRFMRPYINTTFTSCTIEKGFYISLEVLTDGQKLVFNQCKVNETVLTADNYADLVNFKITDNQKTTIGNVAACVAKFVEFK